MYITFAKIQNARTGNILFQYLFTKRISIEFGHLYVPLEEFNHEAFILSDSNARDVLEHRIDISNQHILCNGFFQQSDYYVPLRDTLLPLLYTTEDYWFVEGKKAYMKDFLKGHPFTFTDNDVVVSLRLDDFIQLPCATSDILPPTHYLTILETWNFDTLYIVCDTIRHEWEQKYLAFFEQWNPVFLQHSLLQDCAMMRDCPNLLHSNSTLCWFMSFVSSKRSRIIPQTHFYQGQSLTKIEEKDIVLQVKPLRHQEVYQLHLHPFLKSCIYPLSYCIADECIVDETVLERKTTLFPEKTYGFEDENAYHQMYQSCLFAPTQKKGGWDCLRHYEIMANGCIPLFKDLEKCPAQTLTTFPKQLVQEASRLWNDKSLYDSYVKKMLQHIREHCSASATATYFLKTMNASPKNVLLIVGHRGVNYTRETFWVGLKRHIQRIGGVAIEYPKLDYLYENYGDTKHLYGNGFTYTRRLKEDYNDSNEAILQKVKDKFFDMIIYGKVGPDELHEGSHPNMPLWEHVFKRYAKHQIVYLYGGDECIDLTTQNRYSTHILYHSQFAHCFVREYV